jgi:hypothetical protein
MPPAALRVRPIYLRNLDIMVPYSQVYKYLGTFITHGTPLNEAKHMVCTITLVVDTPYGSARGVDVTPLLHLCCVQP